MKAVPAFAPPAHSKLKRTSPASGNFYRATAKVFQPLEPTIFASFCSPLLASTWTISTSLPAGAFDKIF
jgi:hypothetical protein